MKRLLLSIALLGSCFFAGAQMIGVPGRGYGYPSPYVSQIEFGAGYNIFSHNTYDENDKLGLYLEYRGFVSSDFDLGVQVSTSFGNAVEKNFPERKHFSWQGGIEVLGNKYFWLTDMMAPFIGVGFGPGFIMDKNKADATTIWKSSLIINPRAGIMLFDNLKMGIEYKAYTKYFPDYSYVGFYLGLAFEPMRVFGGRSRGRNHNRPGVPPGYMR